MICLALSGPKGLPFDYMYNKYRNGVYKMVCDVIEDEALRDDVTQEIFERFYKSMGRVQGEAAARRWLYVIAHNTIIYLGKKDATYRKHIVLGLDEEEILAACADLCGETPLDGALKAELSETVKAALGELKPIHSEVIILKYVFEYSPAEIAKLLKLSVNTVYSRLSRAEELLYNKLYGYITGKGGEIDDE